MGIGPAGTEADIGLDTHAVHVAYAKPEKEHTMISTIGICAGSGGSMLLGVDADVYFTGEMAHHEVLASIQSGHNVILCACFYLLGGRAGSQGHSTGGHTNTERGYLPWLKKDIEEFIQEELAQPTDPAEAEMLKGLEVAVSARDEYPLAIV